MSTPAGSGLRNERPASLKELVVFFTLAKEPKNSIANAVRMKRTLPAGVVTLYASVILAGSDPTGAPCDAIGRAIGEACSQEVSPAVLSVLGRLPEHHQFGPTEFGHLRDEPVGRVPTGAAMRLITANASGTTAVWDQSQWDDGSKWG